MCDYDMAAGSKIRIMPDVHAGKGCTIGTTMTIVDKAVPNVVAVSEYKSAPAAYAIDFGVTDDGRTLLIEVNDGYALGSYGLFYPDYSKLLSARWAELTNTTDECDFMSERFDWYGRTNIVTNDLW